MADQIRKYRPGTLIFREGESGDYACLVRAGQIELVKLATPDAPPIATVGPGAMFGELSLVSKGPRMASARAKGDVELLIVDRARFVLKMQALSATQREIFDLFTSFVRDTPVWEKPRPLEQAPPVSEKGQRVQKLLPTIAMAGLLKTGDPFLDVLGNMLVSYAKRRLPPEGAAAG
jgi:hypothetical protein